MGNRIVALDSEYVDKLADAGIKALGIIDFDDVHGPYVRFVTAITSLTARMLSDQNLVARIYISGQQTSMVELEEGERLLIERFSIQLENRQGIGIVFSEVASPISEDRARNIIRELAGRIEGESRLDADSFESYVRNVLG